MVIKMREEPKYGEIYRHFKNKLYQILNIATHSETGEKLVIYQALYGEYGIYARPLDMFMSEVDKEKYPRVEQKYRFEKVSNIGETVLSEKDAKSKEDSLEESEVKVDKPMENNDNVHSYFLEFLDARDYSTKKQILMANRTLFTERELDAIYDIYGLRRKNSDIDLDIADLAGYLDLQEQFEGKRLRK